VHLRPGQTVEYIITDADNRVSNDGVRACALWDGWFGYDRRKYAEMLREAFEPLVIKSEFSGNDCHVDARMIFGNKEKQEAILRNVNDQPSKLGKGV
jgi:hypothetical protein